MDRKDKLNIIAIVAILVTLGTVCVVWGQDLAIPPAPQQTVTVVILRGGQWYSLGKVRLIVMGEQVVIVCDTPAPGPGPTPPGPTTPQPSDPFCAAVAAGLSSVSPGARQHSAEIAATYESVAAEAAATPADWTVAKLLSEVKVRNATALDAAVLSQWRPFWTALQAALVAAKLEADDLAGHIALFGKVAEELRK